MVTAIDELHEAEVRAAKHRLSLSLWCFSNNCLWHHILESFTLHDRDQDSSILFSAAILDHKKFVCAILLV
jgi:hypothetical protein